MSEPEQKTTTPDPTLSEDLFQLYHEFAMFNDYYASFCDALADVTTDNDVLDAGTFQGLNRCCRWMKHRMEEFRVRLDVIQKKSCSETR